MLGLGVFFGYGHVETAISPVGDEQHLDYRQCSVPTTLRTMGLQGIGLTQYIGAPSTPPFDVAQRFRGNVLYVPPGDKIQSFPPHNLSTSKAFRHVDPATGNFQPLEPRWTEATDGKRAGIDFTKRPK